MNKAENEINKEKESVNNYENKLKSKIESTFFENLVWLSSKEAAEYLRKSCGALRVMVFRGYLKPRRFKRRLYFKKYELDKLIEDSI